MYLLVVLGGGLFVIRGAISPGDLVAYVMYVSTLIATIRRIVEFAEQFQRGMTGIERFFEIMDAPVEIQDAPDAVPLQLKDGAIDFKNVSFEYPDDHNHVLKICLCILHRESGWRWWDLQGGGKTTLATVPRF